MKRFNLAVLTSLVIAGTALFMAQGQVAPKDLPTLIQAGDSKQALAQIQAGADVNKAQPDGSTPLLWAVNRAQHDVLEALLAKKANVNTVNEFGGVPLLEATRQNDATAVKMLLDAGAKPDFTNADGETALMLAIKANNLALVETLIGAGANVSNVEKFHNETPLIYAAAESRPEIIKLLLAKGADVKPRALYSDWPSQVTSEPRTQYRPVGGLTALMYAIRGGCNSCVEQLVAAGADVNVPTPEGITPLMLALDNSHNDIAKFLMGKGAKLEVWDWWGRTPLWIAVDRKGAAAGGRGGRGAGGRGPGGLAGAPGAGAAAGAGGRGGQGRGAGGPGAPLGGGGAREAADIPQVSSLEIINALLDAGVNPNPQMNFHRPNDASSGRGRFADNLISTGTTPLFRAVQLNDVEAVDALLKKGANPNLNTMGYSAFLAATGAGAAGGGGGRGGTGGGQMNVAILDLMIQYKADVNARVTGSRAYTVDTHFTYNQDKQPDFEGTTALHDAARAARVDMVKYLLEHGANPDLLDKDGKKAIDVVGVAHPLLSAAVTTAVAVEAVAELAPAAGQAKGKGKGGAPGVRGPDPAALAEIRTLLQNASKK